MKNLHNIEQSGFHKGQYVGYADGPWRIKRDGPTWRASKITRAEQGRAHYIKGDIIYASTLTELSDQLAAYAADRSKRNV